MSTDELYANLTASTLAKIYNDIEPSSEPHIIAEARKVYVAGIENCGVRDFNGEIDLARQRLEV